MLPRSLLSGGRASLPCKRISTKPPPPHIFVFDDPKLFDGANVFTCGLAGTKDVHGSVITVHSNLSHQAATVPFDTAVPWWTLTTRAQAYDTTALPAGFEPLSTQHIIRAGCTTDTAYRLAEVVHDAEYGKGLKLMTTGLIDRYMQGWGLGTVRFLKRRFDFPRWPATGDVNPNIGRQIQRQCQPKVLLGGLTKTLEACLDNTGQFGGVVSTWTVRPNTATWLLQRLEAVLNSWVVSWRYHQAYGAQQSPWGGMTIKKAGLAEIAVPSALLSLETVTKPIETDPWALCPQADRPTLVHNIAGLVNGLNEARYRHDYEHMYAMDAEVQPYLARLYGCAESEFTHIASWFKVRDRHRRPMTTYGALPDLDLNSAVNPRIDEARAEQ